MRRQQGAHQQQIEHTEDECTSSPSQILERVQSDRVTVTKPEEDRRRRTIIVEKKNGSFGFTLQSYGIHYKKEQEIEMITYVDYVDYDGPAYRAGMREGDVILSINGTDMEKADHKTLVNFIKNCDARMRMVVLFEDCVRKVELHMRYIQLQRILQTKMAELEKLCIRERQILEGKWKTHSLPARKKASHTNGEPQTPTQASYTHCRPTLSTEDVAKAQQKQHHAPNNPAIVFAYQYFEPHYSYMLQPANSGEYLLTFESQRYREPQHFIVKTPCEQLTKANNRGGNQANGGGGVGKAKKSQSSCHNYAGQLCNPCIQTGNNSGDNTSLEAYDLASPCCNPHCVPSRRHRSHHHKDHQRKRDSKTEETQTEPQHHQQQQQQQPTHQSRHHQNPVNFIAPRRYFHFGSGLVSQCSLHSCTSSELSAIAPTTTGETSTSCTTSLSTDTLYWDGALDTSHQHHNMQVKSANHHYEPSHNFKPKSWDNLATKAFGGYGFGYGYFDTSAKCPVKNRQKSTQQYIRIEKNSTIMQQQPQYTPHTQRRYFQPTKSTESLLSLPKYSSDVLSDSSVSCECLDVLSPSIVETSEARFFQSPRQSVVSPSDPNFGYYSARRSTSRSDYPKNVVSTSSEATRL